MIVEVAYALPDEVFLEEFEVPKESTIEEIIKHSGVLERYPDIDLHAQSVGIFSKIAKLTDTLRERDRIEIYRPLIADPKEVRKRKALEKEQQKEQGASNK